MSRLSDYVTEQSGFPEAPTDGFTYGRRGQDGSWQVTLNKSESDLAYANIVHTHPYVGLSGNETIEGLKQFNGNMGIGAASNPSYGLNVAGSLNLGSGSNYFINGSPISVFVDAPSDGEIYGRQNAGWVITAGGEGGTVTNLSMQYAASSATIVNSGGASTTINAATTSLAGLMTSSDKTLLGTFLTRVDLSQNRTTTTVTITNTGGNGVILPSATTSFAGVMTAAQVSTLNSVITSVDLGYSRSSTSNTITNTAGANATLLAATTTLAGVMTAADKVGLDNVQAPGSWNTSSTSSVVNVTYDGDTMFSIGLPGLINPSIYAGVIDPINYAKLTNMFNNSTTYQTSSKVYLRGASVGMYMYETAATSGNRNWTMNASGNTLYVAALSDAGTLGSSFFGFSRSSNSITELRAYGTAKFVGPIESVQMTAIKSIFTTLLPKLQVAGVISPAELVSLTALKNQI